MVDSTFIPVKPSKADLESAALNTVPGQTAEQYIASRGGVSASGYYGDTYNPAYHLTDAEYADARKTEGGVNAALHAKNPTFWAGTTGSKLLSPKSVGTSTNTRIYTATDGTEFTDQNAYATYQASVNLNKANKYLADIDAENKAAEVRAQRESGFSILKIEFEKYNLGSLVEKVKDLIINGVPIAEATLKLRGMREYQTRFSGNTIRLELGKNLYDEGTYLALENDFQESFTAYGQTALLGATRESAQSKFAEYIGTDKSPLEIKNRIKLAVEEVDARPEILKTFNEFFPSLDKKDLVSYFLSPKDTLSRLQTKVETAKMGTAASRQGLVSNLNTASELAELGLTEEAANLGYQKVSRDLPTLEKLGNIEGQTLNQKTAENAYLKGLASEQRKIDQAAERERNRFDASSGNPIGAYSTGYLKKPSSAGQY